MRGLRGREGETSREEERDDRVLIETQRYILPSIVFMPSKWYTRLLLQNYLWFASRKPEAIIVAIRLHLTPKLRLILFM